MRILVVENDSSVAQSVELMLKTAGFIVQVTDLGEEAIDLAKVYEYDLITLSLKLPDMYGLQVLKALRAAKIDTPVIVLGQTQAVDIKVSYLEAGADDFLSRPFHQDELIARTRAVSRRSLGHARPSIELGNVCLRINERCVYVGDSRLNLKPKEFGVLELLMLRKNIPIESESFLQHLYGHGDAPENRIIGVYVSNVRKKLAGAKATAGIVTIWGFGYSFRDLSDMACT
ncbi:MAG: DNA-binding response regulator [Parcubacteria group bacterium]|nr:DNA-binding response regulator [Parcubacteria group bacterium]